MSLTLFHYFFYVAVFPIVRFYNAFYFLEFYIFNKKSETDLEKAEIKFYLFRFLKKIYKQ